MLNEAWNLAKARERVGLRSERTHPRVKSPGKTSGPCLRVRLAMDGRVEAIESVTEDEWSGFWTVMEGQMNSFPFVRHTQPLVLLTRDDDTWRKLGFGEDGRRKKGDRPANIGDVLQLVLDGKCSPAVDAKWSKAYREKACELRQCGAGEGGRYQALVCFAHAVQAAAADPEQLMMQIGQVAIAAVCDGRLQGVDVDTVELLLVGKMPKEPGKRSTTKVQLAFDLADDHQYAVRLYTQEMRRYLIAALPRPDGGPEIECALAGLPGQRQKGAFPKFYSPRFPKGYPPFSMNSEAPCNSRYGMTDAETVPVSTVVADTIADALTTVLDANHEGKSWRSVASGKFDRKSGKTVDKLDVLLVYPEAKPELDERVVSIFGADDDTIQSQFEADMAVVCQALDGIARSEPPSRLQILIFRAVSDGQAQIAVRESPTVAEVIAAARRWSDAAANVPEVIIRLPPAEKKHLPTDATPRTPYADQVVRLLSTQWLRDGSSKKQPSGKRQESNRPLPGVGLGEVLHIMLRTPGKWESARDRMLDLLVQRLSPLLIGIGNMICRSPVDRSVLDDYPASSRVTALRAVSVAGILLHAHNRPKEVYMSDSAFSVGQFLKLADTLHKDYCIVVRKGSLPPSLIGNAMMPTAVDNPRRAVADLNDRMRLYIGWAKTAREPKGAAENDPSVIAVREARKTMRRFEPLAEHLIRLGLPERCDNTMKAEMLLGYLARIQDSQPPDEEKDHE